MIDISSLPEHDLSGLEGFGAKVLYKVIRYEWLNYHDEGSGIAGVFLDHDTARAFVKAMAEREEYIARGEQGFDDLEIFWDRDSNCDDGFSIIIYMEDGDEFCFDYAIEQVPLWYKEAP